MTTGPRIRWSDVAAWRARRHHLDRRVPSSKMHAVVGDLCGLHAQLMSSAELSFPARVEGLEPDSLRVALWKERSLVKLWAMRGTLHVLPADEYPMWQAALGTARHYRRPVWLRAFGVTERELERLLDAVEQVLDGKQLTRDELADEVARVTRSKALGSKLRESWGVLLKPASFTGRLCFAPDKGRNVRFTGPRRWLRLKGQPVDPEDAYPEIVRRFLTVHGPASREDLSRWWAFLDPAPAQRRIEALGDEVATIDVEGRSMYVLAKDLRALAKAAPVRSVRLLPAFDQYVVAATLHAEQLMPGPFKPRAYRPQGWLSPVLLVNGRMEGVWKHEKKGKRVLVSIEPFVAVSRHVKLGAETEAERIARFLGGELDLTWG